VTVSYGEWHTLTVKPNPDHADHPDEPALLYELEHPESCPRGMVEWDVSVLVYDCWEAGQVAQFGDYPDMVGLPTEPGQYRMRCWGEWSGSIFDEADGGVEYEEEPAEEK